MSLCKQEDCTGCTACMTACPKNAISMEYNENGFLYPKIDKKKCIDCGICTKVCEKLRNHMLEKEHNCNYFKVYAIKLKDDKKRMESQSGGLFTALAETILEKKGVVYGAGFDEKLHVKHMRIDNIDELYKLKNSKYVQSDVNNVFSQIIMDLNNDKFVLFSGTSCQVAGIEALLDFKNINKEKFYSCDLICHGVPSPIIYEKYLSFLEEKNSDKIKEFNFRDKKVNGWHNHVETYRFQKLEQKRISRVYTELFYSNMCLRDSCDKCKYASMNRAGDITIGDCWGIEKTNPELWNDNKGISVALLQTSKGENLINLSRDKIDIKEIDNNYKQINMVHPSKVSTQKEKFWKDYKKLSFEKLLKKYTCYGGIKFKIKRKILMKMKKW